MPQGDPLSMLFYSVAALPLVRALKGDGRWFQSWYADDSVCAGSLDDSFVGTGPLWVLP